MLLVLYGFRFCLAHRPKHPIPALWSNIRANLLTPSRICGALPYLLIFPLFAGAFTKLKSAIPLIQPFSWDHEFERLDRWLHGGIAPWELLHPLLAHPLATHVLNIAYNLWFVLLYLTWTWQAFAQGDLKLRAQFFWSVLLSWILLGNGAATFFSSAGPCYFGLVTGMPDPYQPLLAYLQEANRSYPIWALDAQRMVWESFQQGIAIPAEGISAMPSMHVATALLFALLGWGTHRWLGVALTGFFLLILIGSIHLGWHYAVDGYAGALGVALIWWATGKALNRTANAGKFTVSTAEAQR
jgi:hypothetical protein